jgi:hypothetical protein
MTETVNSIMEAQILRSVRDTARRFENSSGGGKEWRATLTEIIDHLPGGQYQLSLDLDRKLSDDLMGTSSFILDDGGDIDILGHHPQSSRFGLLCVDADDRSRRSGIYQWTIGPPTNTGNQHVIHSRQCAWFIERLRQLDYYVQDSLEEDAMYDLRLSVASISWRTLIKFLQFTLEQSNWTTELRPPHLPPLTFEEKLERCFERISGQDRLGQNAYSVSLHMLFNQEQLETALGEETDLHTLSRAELVAEQEQEATLKKEKEQLVEILGILGEKAEKSELGEGAYKGYADLLMKFHKILGEERQRIVNV